MTKQEIIDRIFSVLKTKAAELGFNTEELKNAAESASGFLNPEDDVKDEDINKCVDLVLPVLKLTQKAANRVIDKAKKEQKKEPDDDPNKDPKKKHGEGTTEEPEGKDGELLKALNEIKKSFEDYSKKNDERWTKLEGSKTAETRKDKLMAVLKDSGSYGERVAKRFARMQFESDEEFNEFLEEEKAAYEDYKKATSNVEIPPAGAGGKPDGDPNKPFTDDELSSIASLY